MTQTAKSSAPPSVPLMLRVAALANFAAILFAITLVDIIEQVTWQVVASVLLIGYSLGSSVALYRYGQRLRNELRELDAGSEPSDPRPIGEGKTAERESASGAGASKWVTRRLDPARRRRGPIQQASGCSPLALTAAGLAIGLPAVGVMGAIADGSIEQQVGSAIGFALAWSFAAVFYLAPECRRRNRRAEASSEPSG